MRRKEDRPLTKHTILLYDGDFDKLMALYPRPGASTVVRKLVRKFLKDLETREKKNESPMNDDDVEV